jgi:glycosyltransferase involved in cell wall biosynthesis
MHLVVIGNGGTAVDPSGRHFTERHTARLLIDLARSGMHPTFIQPRVPLSVNASLHGGELFPSVVRSLPVSRTRALDLWRVWLALIRAKLVYIYFPGTLPMVVARLCRIIGKPYALYLRGEQFAVTGRDAEAFRHARFVCCVGGLGDRVRGLTNQLVQVQPMLDIGREDIHRRDLTARPPGPWNLLFVGLLAADKGVPELIEAAELLSARGFPFGLAVVGGGPLYDELFRRYGNDPAASIRVLGVIDDTAALFTEFEKADILVMPTHHEGFPRVLYEAMIKSTVIVTTFVGGIAGVMRAGVDCIEIPCRNAVAIADAVESITADPPRMQALADAALCTVLGVLMNHPTHLDAVVQRMRG